jgi:hypothetical protein
MLVCSALEAGRDGVGDYCRVLAGEFEKLGHPSVALGLNDRFVERAALAENSSDRRRFVRLPASVPASERYAQAARVIEDWRPDWLSLNFVSYGFQKRGMPVHELWRLPQLFADRKLAVMLHELWVGLDDDHSPKNRFLYGPVQRRLLFALLRRLKPARLQTTNASYREVLARHRLDAEVVPIFGNVPVGAETAETWLYDGLAQQGALGPGFDRSRCWLFGMFGLIDPSWPAIAIFSRLAEIARRADRRIIIVSIGNAGEGAASLFERAKTALPGLSFALLGRRPAEQISQFLNTMDFGLSSYPYALLGKSGAVAAMLEHGLPVIVSRGHRDVPFQVVDPLFETLVWQSDSALDEKLISPPLRRRYTGRPTDVAKMLIARFG